MGSDFISNSFKLWGVQDYVTVTMRYVGIIHLNQEQVNFGLTLSCSVITIPSFPFLFH
jgi:endoribonuclease Dicer